LTDGSEVDPLEALLAIEEITKLKARYFRCIDTKEWEGLAQVFTADAVLDTSEEVGHVEPMRGRAEIVERISTRLNGVETVHHGHMPEVEILSSHRARGIWSMEDELRWPEGSPLRHMHGYGHYHENYERTENGWRIASSRLTRLRIDLEWGSRRT
jgi:SnoaL-like domain